VVEKRVGQYYNDNGSLNYTINGAKLPFPVNEAITIEPFNITNLFFNYTVKGSSYLRGTKFQLSLNNIADSRNIVGITPAVAATSAVHYAPNGGDFLNMLPGRSITLTITGGYAPRR